MFVYRLTWLSAVEAAAVDADPVWTRQGAYPLDTVAARQLVTEGWVAAVDDLSAARPRALSGMRVWTVDYHPAAPPRLVGQEDEGNDRAGGACCDPAPRSERGQDAPCAVTVDRHV